jgi:hypothetical protein
VEELSSTYRVPKEPVEVELRIDGGVRMSGQVYLSSQAEGHPGRERVLDLLNKPDRPYLPIRAEGDHRLVSKKRIVLLRTLDDRDRRLTTDALTESRTAQVRLSVAWGASGGASGAVSLDGSVIIEGRPERRRLLDYLNAAPRFFPLIRDDGVYLVNQDFVVHLKERE